VPGEILAAELQEPVAVEGQPLTLYMLQRGIHKPRQIDRALALTTTQPKHRVDAPYADRFGIFLYHYRDPQSQTKRAHAKAASDNEAVRVAMHRVLPATHLRVMPGRYWPLYPAYVVADIQNVASSVWTTSSWVLATSTI
jgi:hypothetical protein